MTIGEKSNLKKKTNEKCDRGKPRGLKCERNKMETKFAKPRGEKISKKIQLKILKLIKKKSHF